MKEEEERKTRRKYSLWSILVLLFLQACSSTKISPVPNSILGIVPYYQPTGLHAIFAGKIFPYRIRATKEDEEALTKILLADIQKETEYDIRTIVVSKEQKVEESPLEYWSSIGKEQGVTLLLIPQIMEWREAEYNRGTYIPAKVVIEYYLFDVSEKKIIERSRYYEEYANTEYDLRYDSRPNGMFFKKHPSRMELAKDSIYKMLIDCKFVRNRKERNIFAQ